MSNTLFSSDLLARLRRSVLVSGVLFLSSFAGMCGDDDDDDDGGTGPSADCIDEIDLDVFGIDEDDVEAIGVNGNESGSLSTSDPSDDGYYFDTYALGVESDSELEITLNPSDFDAVLLIFSADGELLGGSDDEEDPEATEVVSGEFEEGCYVIGVSSFETEETGSYSLSVDEN